MLNLVKKSLSDQIYDILKNDILSGNIAFGEILVNRDLQSRFGVSSTPVRDAILKLYADGLIDSIERTGSRVIDFNLTIALEVNEMLMFILQHGMSSSYKKCDRSALISELRENVAQQKENIDTDDYFKYDYKFHKTFVDYSNNSRLIKLYKEYNVLHEVLLRSFYNPINSRERKELSITYHERIIDKLEKGDLAAALALNEEHYKIAENIFKSNL